MTELSKKYLVNLNLSNDGGCCCGFSHMMSYVCQLRFRVWCSRQTKAGHFNHGWTIIKRYILFPFGALQKISQPKYIDYSLIFLLIFIFYYIFIYDGSSLFIFYKYIFIFLLVNFISNLFYGATLFCAIKIMFKFIDIFLYIIFLVMEIISV